MSDRLFDWFVAAWISLIVLGFSSVVGVGIYALILASKYCP